MFDRIEKKVFVRQLPTRMQTDEKITSEVRPGEPRFAKVRTHFWSND